jgi:hypothetical protein
MMARRRRCRFFLAVHEPQLVTINWIDLHGGDSSSVRFIELPPGVRLLHEALHGASRETVAHTTPVMCGVKLDPAELQPIVDVAAKYKLIPAPFDAREMMDAASLRA